jgi:hypothetical protein
MRTDERVGAPSAEVDPEIEEAIARAQRRVEEAREKADQACAERDAVKKELDTLLFDIAHGIQWTTLTAVVAGAAFGLVASIAVRWVFLLVAG